MNQGFYVANRNGVQPAFDVPISQVMASLREHVRSGIFALEHGTNRQQGVYRAGPRLPRPWPGAHGTLLLAVQPC